MWQIDDTSSDEWCRRCDLWEWFTNRGQRYSKSRSAFSVRDIGKWSTSWWDLREWAPMLIPELQEINRLFAQIDILHQQLIKFWSRDTLICERVLGKWTPTRPGVKFWMTKIRFYPAGHKKTAQQQNTQFCRVITLWCENEVFEKIKHSSLTVGHIWSSPNSIGSTIIIY